MHRHEAIRAYTAAVLRAVETYESENHCACGEIVHFLPNNRDNRVCDRCKMRAAIWKEVAA